MLFLPKGKLTFEVINKNKKWHSKIFSSKTISLNVLLSIMKEKCCNTDEIV